MQKATHEKEWLRILAREFPPTMKCQLYMIFVVTYIIEQNILKVNTLIAPELFFDLMQTPILNGFYHFLQHLTITSSVFFCLR